MREMAEHITVVESRHSNLTENHLQKGAECREDTKFVLVETETSSRGEVSTFHDTGGNEDFGMLLVDDFETSGALEITYR
jgi:hypothetical protein